MLGGCADDVETRDAQVLNLRRNTAPSHGALADRPRDVGSAKRVNGAAS